jgi:uncharacterized repeat protein (TIGR03803 family)
MTQRLARINALLLAAAMPLLAGSAEAKQKETVVYSFGTVPDDGIGPQDGLIADRSGNMYGTTLIGGAFNKGTVFRLTPDGAETVVYSFAGAPNDGDEPNAALAIDSKGILYGTTIAGGPSGKGVVFQFDPAHGQEQILHGFCQTDCSDGNSPIAPVTVGKKGVLYGTTALGGQGTVQANSGVAFRLDPPGRHGTAWTETVLYNFCSQTSCADGKSPSAGRLLLTASGELYGTAQAGQQGGTLYALSGSGGGFQLLHVFTTGGSNDGVTPKTGVVADKSGTLYGTTSGGGLHSCGTAFSFDPSSFVYQSLYSFCSQANDPTTIYGGLTLVENKSGTTLYGTGLAGGAYGHGALYSLTPPATLGAPWNEATLHGFCPHTGCRDGSTPGFAAPLDVKGEFYGMTTSGGAHGGGVIYRYGKP